MCWRTCCARWDSTWWRPAPHSSPKAARTRRTTRATRMRTATATSTDSALLDLLWLASPALPIGGFSYSEGLEAAVDAGLIGNEQQAGDWLMDQLHLSLARAELPVTAQAMLAWRAGDRARIAQLNDWVSRTRETSEMRQQSEQMGRSLVEWLKSVRPGALARVAANEHIERTRTGLTYPIAWALAMADSAATLRQALMACAFGWAENMMQAAVK